MAILKTSIKEHREKVSMKQSELAKLVGVRRETIVHLENGKYNPSLKLAMDIANIFDTKVENMFEFIDEK
ncbi:MAG: helix-turn-helix transcriptional regulator [Romboutsia sp.]